MSVIFSTVILSYSARVFKGFSILGKALGKFLYYGDERSVADNGYYDLSSEAYYLVEYGSDVCEYVDRDDLLERIGEYETTFVYIGEYDKNGKIRRGEVAV